MAQDRLIDAIAAELFGRRADCLPFPDAPGVCAYFLRPGTAPPPLAPAGLELGANGLPYVGTSTNLRRRDHLTPAHSGFSTLRRLLGALLKDDLRLVAGPRAPGPSATNRRNYRFLGTGEQDLTRWMRQHLTYASCTLSLAEIDGIEMGLIRHLCPPLNLKGWDNPRAHGIREQRDRCVAEASGRPRAFP